MTRTSPVVRVVVGVDFDEASTAALIVAGALANAGEAAITLLHATTVEMPAYFTSAQMEALEEERQQDRSRRLADLRAFAAPHLAVPVDTLLEEGTPEASILRVAPSFDLIILGTRQVHGFRRWWLGSTAEAIVRQSPRPVLVVPVGSVTRERLRARPGILAVGSDATAERWVNVLKTALQGPVVRARHIDDCAPDRVQGADFVVVSSLVRNGGRSAVETIVDLLKDCPHPVLFVPPADQIVEGSSS